ncbi:hypothetical protein OF83DRAFT_1172865 [Amylostereum chailletii]|nr:hypothetical protein OF83DRAFT_1172865 [Amylostereum chailletii]
MLVHARFRNDDSAADTARPAVVASLRMAGPPCKPKTTSQAAVPHLESLTGDVETLYAAAISSQDPGRAPEHRRRSHEGIPTRPTHVAVRFCARDFEAWPGMISTMVSARTLALTVDFGPILSKMRRTTGELPRSPAEPSCSSSLVSPKNILLPSLGALSITHINVRLEHIVSIYEKLDIDGSIMEQLLAEVDMEGLARRLADAAPSLTHFLYIEGRPPMAWKVIEKDADGLKAVVEALSREEEATVRETEGLHAIDFKEAIRDERRARGYW